jgi:hypothetical protein
MKQTMNPVNVRIEWCRRQSALARTEPEIDGWRAEENGLRDALMNSDHTDDYRLCPSEIFQRYVLGFQDGTAMLRATWVERIVHDATTGTSCPATTMRQNMLQGDER